MAAVPKTVGGNTSVGSNPTLSSSFSYKFFLTVFARIVYDLISMKQTTHFGMRPQGAELNRATCVDP
jgi:hypothetical protein